MYLRGIDAVRKLAPDCSLPNPFLTPCDGHVALGELIFYPAGRTDMNDLNEELSSGAETPLNIAAFKSVLVVLRTAAHQLEQDLNLLP